MCIIINDIQKTINFVVSKQRNITRDGGDDKDAMLPKNRRSHNNNSID